jgi:hypothetical protein
MFSFLRSLHIAYILTSSVRGFFLPYPHQHLLLVVFLILAILREMMLNLIVVLICISFMTRDGEYFFMCFRPFGLLEKVLFSSVSHFFIDSLILGGV